MFRAYPWIPFNTLEVNWRNKNRVSGSQACPNCQQGETLKHFLLDCDAYNEIRAKYAFLAKPHNKDADEIMGYLLLMNNCDDENDINSRKQALQEMWKQSEFSLSKYTPSMLCMFWRNVSEVDLFAAACPTAYAYILCQLSSQTLGAYLGVVSRKISCKWSLCSLNSVQSRTV